MKDEHLRACWLAEYAALPAHAAWMWGMKRADVRSHAGATPQIPVVGGEDDWDVAQVVMQLVERGPRGAVT